MAAGKPALSYKSRKRLALLILILGLPLYIAVVWGIMGAMTERPPILVELAIYVGLGVVWALPFRFVFKGVGQADPDAPGESDGRK
ncbi:MAG: DUF2842 domain-containing protein [Paracoccaceae bacterium]